MAFRPSNSGNNNNPLANPTTGAQFEFGFLPDGFTPGGDRVQPSFASRSPIFGANAAGTPAWWQNMFPNGFDPRQIFGNASSPGWGGPGSQGMMDVRNQFGQGQPAQPSTWQGLGRTTPTAPMGYQDRRGMGRPRPTGNGMTGGK